MDPSPRTRKTFLFCVWERLLALASLSVVVSLRVVLYAGIDFGSEGEGGFGEHVLANASSVGEVQSLVVGHCRTDINVLCRRRDCANTPNPILSVLYQGYSEFGLRLSERCDSPHPSVVLPGLLPASLSFVDVTQAETALAPLDGVCLRVLQNYYIAEERGEIEWCHNKYFYISAFGKFRYVHDSEMVETYGPNWIHDDDNDSSNLTGLETFMVMQNFTLSRDTGGDSTLRLRFSCCPDDPDVKNLTALATLIPSDGVGYLHPGAAIVCTPLLCKLGPQINEKRTGRIALGRLWREVIASAEDQAFIASAEDQAFGYRDIHYSRNSTNNKLAQTMNKLARLLTVSFVELFCGTQTDITYESDHILTVLNQHQQNVYTFRAGAWNKSELLEIMTEASEEYDRGVKKHLRAEWNLTKPVLDFLRSPQDFTIDQNSKSVLLSRERFHYHPYDPRLGPTGDYTRDKCLRDHSKRSNLLTEECRSVMAVALPKIKKMASQEMNEFQSSFGWFTFALSIFVLALQYCHRRSSLPGGYAHASLKRERQRGRRRLGQCLADDILRQSIEMNVTKAVGDNMREKVMHKLQLAAEQGYNEDDELAEDRGKSQRCSAGTILFHHLFLFITFLSGALALETYLSVLAVVLAGFIMIAGLESKDSGDAPSARELSELIPANMGEDSTNSKIDGKSLAAPKESTPAPPDLDISTADDETFPNKENSTSSKQCLSAVSA